ncbi:MAG: ATP-binding protein [Pseudomonadota bacterium]|nr:ATP-binding protein [Pseudomonadota bacterium]
MRIVPSSLLWRTLAVVVAALALSQVTALWLFDEYITQPRVALTIRQFVSHLKTVSVAMQTIGPAQQPAFIARIAEQDGIRISPVGATDPLRPAADRPALRQFRERLRESFGPGADVYVPAATQNEEARPRVLWVRLPAGERQFWVAFPRARIERDPITAVVAWSVAGLGIAILATFLLMWRLNRPLGELARAAEKLGRGGNPAPVAETGPAEIRGLARAFNQMKDDLRQGERERATFLAGVSHDLRTPLSRLRLDVEMLEGKVDSEVQRAMVADLEDMNAIIDQFIDFARSEAAEPLSPVNLSELARSCAERALRSGAPVRCELAEVAPMPMRPLALQRLIDNLLGNAARHAGGEVVLRTASERRAVTLAVLDRGPGIPPGTAERLKQPFTRADEARSGSSGAGLGLAIANRVAVLHGGRLDLLAREGGGLEARVTFQTSEV